MLWLASCKEPTIGQNLKYKLNRIKLNRLINAKCNAATTELKTMYLLFLHQGPIEAFYKRKIKASILPHTLLVSQKNEE